ncbi:MAG: DNA alkylation repair protein [Cardiobacteriaceae bacterium]|nr:DNA alkylation repair protein [Cardiobacteriaceae bacterium]
MKEIKMKDFIDQQLKQYADKSYLDYARQTAPEMDLLGVKVPDLKKIVTQVKRNYKLPEILSYIREDTNIFEIETLKALLLTKMKLNEQFRIRLFAEFIPKLKTWSVCDTLCEKRRDNVEDMHLWYEFCLSFIESTKDYERRFFYVFLLKHFIERENLEILMTALEIEESNNLYVQRAAAWAVSEFAVEFRDEMLEFLKTYPNRKIARMAIMKIVESNKFTAEDKVKFKAAR